MDIKRIKQIVSEELKEIAPPGWEKSIKKMKKSGDIDNPWKLAWWHHKQGHKPSQKEDIKKSKSDDKFHVFSKQGRHKGGFGSKADAKQKERKIQSWPHKTHYKKDKDTGMIKHFEASYEGNLGVSEVFQFYEVANEEQIAMLNKLMGEQNWTGAWQLVQKVTGTKLKGKEFGNNEG